jgi:Uma2 family endonuclease
VFFPLTEKGRDYKPFRWKNNPLSDTLPSWCAAYAHLVRDCVQSLTAVLARGRKIMGLAPANQSTDEFIAWENAQPERHEFYRGETFAMVGARRVHGLVSLNMASLFKHVLSGTPCQVFAESMKLQVADESLFYPDVFVTCDPTDLKTDYIFRAPTVIVEVLSESTQAYDRGVKFAAYRRLASLKEYLLIDPDLRSIEVFRRGDEGLFTLHDYTGLDYLRLQSLECELAMADVFEGLEAE